MQSSGLELNPHQSRINCQSTVEGFYQAVPVNTILNPYVQLQKLSPEGLTCLPTFFIIVVTSTGFVEIVTSVHHCHHLVKLSNPIFANAGLRKVAKG